MDVTKMPRKLWEHPDPKSTAMWQFMQEANKTHGLDLQVKSMFLFPYYFSTNICM